MKFLLVKNLSEDVNFKPILSGLLLFTLLYLIIDIFVKQESFGIMPLDVLNSLLGNEDEYIDPMDKSVFLEFWHIEIFLIMLLLFTLNAMYMRLTQASKVNLFVSHTMMLSALVALISIAITYFFSPSFVYIYSISFVLWHILALYATLISLIKLYV